MWSRKSGPFLGGTALGRIFLAFGARFVIVGSYPLINSCSAFTNCSWFTRVSAESALPLLRVGGWLTWMTNGWSRELGFIFCRFLTWRNHVHPELAQRWRILF